MNYKTTIVILIGCNALLSALLIWSQAKISELRIELRRAKAEKSAHLWADIVTREGYRVREEVTSTSNGRKDYPPYMSYPRKSSINVCAGCVHEERPDTVFPCDECKRKLNGEHDMFIEKVKDHG